MYFGDLLLGAAERRRALHRESFAMFDIVSIADFATSPPQCEFSTTPRPPEFRPQGLTLPFTLQLLRSALDVDREYCERRFDDYPKTSEPNLLSS